MTKREQQALDFIKGYMAECIIAPTLAEIASGLGIRSKGVAHRYVHSLEQQGLLVLAKDHKRGIRLHQRQGIPLIGAFSAGSSVQLLAQSRLVDIAELFLNPGFYGLQVQGDALVAEGICDGDVIVCRKSATASNGQLVLALLNHEEAVVKRVRWNQDTSKITLIPIKARIAPTTYDADKVVIEAICLGLVRTAW